MNPIDKPAKTRLPMIVRYDRTASGKIRFRLTSSRKWTISGATTIEDLEQIIKPRRVENAN